MAVLVTGGAGYIGSHTAIELLESGKDIVIIDNFYNSCPKVLDRIKELSGRDFSFEECDIRDREGLDKVFEKYDIDGVIHFAAFSSVAESVELPQKYFKNNYKNTLNLLKIMREFNVDKFILSSTAAVYGNPTQIPITEDTDLKPINPYGHSKFITEKALEREAEKGDFNYVSLRYFNAAGADFDCEVGELHDPETHLIPLILDAAIGKRDSISIFGTDYDTPDGTCIRDYIHVVDLADGHVKAIEKIKENPGVEVYNLGTGNGYSVLDMVKNFEAATGVKVPYVIKERRPGDIATCYADAKKAKEELGWEAQFGIKEMCEDAWRWQSQNPNGYEE